MLRPELATRNALRWHAIPAGPTHEVLTTLEELAASAKLPLPHGEGHHSMPAHEDGEIGVTAHDDGENGAATFSTRTLWTRVLPALLLLGFAVDLAMYSLYINDVFYVEGFGVQPAMAATICRSVYGVFIHLTPLLGAYLADTRWGRLGAILRGVLLKLVGLILIWLSAWPSLPRGVSLVLFFTGLFGGVVTGSGATRATQSAFGLDQFTLPLQSASKDAFLSLGYLLTQSSGVVAMGLGPIGLHGLPSHGIPQEFGYFTQFAIGAASALIGCVAFWLSASRFTRARTQGSELGKLLSDLKRTLKAGGSNGAALIGAAVCLAMALVASNSAIFIRDPSARAGMAVGGLAASVSLLLCLFWSTKNLGWVRAAGGGRDQTTLVSLCGMLPFIIVLWMANYVSRATFGLQACQMNQNLLGMKLPPSIFFGMGNHLPWLNAIVVLVHQGLLALLALCGRPRPGMMAMMGAGHVLVMLSMLCATLAEGWRKLTPLLDGERGLSSCPTTGDQDELRVRQLSLLYLLPQAVCVSAGDYIFYLGTTEFFYTQAPVAMRSLSAALGLAAISCGGLLATGINLLSMPWVTANLDDGNLERVYALMVALLLPNIAGFLRVARRRRQSSETGDLELVTGAGVQPAPSAGPHTMVESTF